MAGLAKKYTDVEIGGILSRSLQMAGPMGGMAHGSGFHAARMAQATAQLGGDSAADTIGYDGESAQLRATTEVLNSPLGQRALIALDNHFVRATVCANLVVPCAVRPGGPGRQAKEPPQTHTATETLFAATHGVVILERAGDALLILSSYPIHSPGTNAYGRAVPRGGRPPISL